MMQYEGELLDNGIKHGKGKARYPNGDVYEGEYRYDASITFMMKLWVGIINAMVRVSFTLPMVRSMRGKLTQNMLSEYVTLIGNGKTIYSMDMESIDTKMEMCMRFLLDIYA